MEPNPQVTPTLTLRYAAVVPSDYKGGENRLVPAALMETCMTKTRQNSPLRHKSVVESGTGGIRLHNRILFTPLTVH